MRFVRKQPISPVQEELPVPAGIIPHFLLKRKKKAAPLAQGPANHAAQKKVH
ncbi:hypothetical protein [Desmospora activa]|uniref:Uncharacterized protein n=1 Tax=Desmospora activa DSM 45169 TaxID=1121389 RepID=A0A2T4Z6S4_9BACL|nr:hypothetical protein [Desmospora activa]PTM57592.1 hypothetical protein C8J48_0141 [Desmospora activa DSM 45169]